MSSELTRRECLKIGAAAGLGSALLPRLGAQAEAGLPLSYLEAGRAALAHTRPGYWANGHYGAALIAAYFFAREQELDERTRKALRAELDAFRESGRQFFEFETPKAEAVPERVGEIARSLDEGIAELRG